MMNIVLGISIDEPLEYPQTMIYARKSGKNGGLLTEVLEHYQKQVNQKENHLLYCQVGFYLSVESSDGLHPPVSIYSRILQ